VSRFDGLIALDDSFCLAEGFPSFRRLLFGFPCFGALFFVHISRRQDANFPEKTMASRGVKAQVFPAVK
jgi:hypothetical protein